MTPPKPLLDLIGKYEADGAVAAQGVATPYDVVWSLIPREHRPQAWLGSPLTRLTVQQVLTWQRDVVLRGSKSSAAGRFQFIRKTLERLVDAVRIDRGAKFDEALQDRLATMLLIEAGWDAVVAGSMRPVSFADRLARVWASLPVQHDQQGSHGPVKRGQSYYVNDGLNAAHATPEAVVAAVELALRATENAPPPAEAPETAVRLAALEASVAEITATLAAIGALLRGGA